MSAFGGMVLTNKGRNLQAKAQAGTKLNFNRIAVGDGQLGSSSIVDLNALKNEIKSLSISKLKTLSGGKAVVGTVISNQDIATGFYFREIGVFAQDPDLGEILYCYANCGSTAEYIPAGGGTDIIEKSIDVITIVGTASNITATIEQSLVYASAQELLDHENDTTAHGLSGKISHSIATAANDFLVASGTGVFVKKTLAQVKTILGLGGAAYKDIGVAGGVASHDTVETHLADYANRGLTAIAKSIIGLDLNTIKDTGFYKGNNLINSPDATTGFFYVQVIKHADTYCVQIAYTIDQTPQKAYIRRLRNTFGWDSWKKTLNQDDYDTLFQYANNGKTDIANAVTAKGVSASPTDTFAVLATKIGQIITGKKTASGTIAIGTDGLFTVSGLNFTPSFVHVNWNGQIACTYSSVYSLMNKANVAASVNQNAGYNTTVLMTAPLTVTGGSFTGQFPTSGLARSIYWVAEE